MEKTGKWSKEDDEKLIKNIRSGKTAFEIAVILGRSKKAVQERCRRLNIHVAYEKNKQKAPLFSSVDILCPFFNKLYRGKRIYCEGLGESGNLLLTFGEEKEWLSHVNRFCTRDYKSCPIARIVLEKYNEN